MAFKLTREDSGVFRGLTGRSFEVEVVPVGQGGPFLVHSVCYGNTCLVQPPFIFDVIAGSKGLAAVYDWDVEGAPVELREVDGGSSRLLRSRLYREDEPFQSVLIRGF
jgi:hypothetical protein